MNTPYLKKYQPKYYKDFTIDKEYIELLNTMKKIDNLNILLVGDPGCGKPPFYMQVLGNIIN